LEIPDRFSMSFWHNARISSSLIMQNFRYRMSRSVAIGLALFGCSLVPSAAGAEPILLEASGTPTSGAPCDASEPTWCGLFVVDPGSQLLNGSFEFDNDVALFQFTLLEQFTFAAATTSYADAGLQGFDPLLTLYGPGGVQMTAPPDGEVVFNDDRDFDTGDFDAQLPVLLLGPGLYTLALAQTGNNPHESLMPLELAFDAADPLAAAFIYGWTAGPEGNFFGRSGSFAIDLTLTPVAMEPIPEPGTLSLLILGSAAMAAVRRRRRTTQQS
jgi:hypothetical protein